MNAFARILMGLAVLTAAGCAGGSGVGPPTVAPTVDVTGRWVGTWTAVHSNLGNGNIEMTIKQTGSNYSGNLIVTGAPTDPSGPTEGVVSGNELRVIRPTSITGYLTVQGDAMTGKLGGVIEANATLKRQQ
jgi:hypothetical protein